MRDRKKTKEQFLRRPILLRRRVAKLKNSATERKRVEGLRESEEWFRTIFEKAAIGIGLTDLEGRVLSVNPAFLRMLGYAGEELTGKSFLEFTHADDVEKERKSFRQLIERKDDSLQLEKRYIRKDGQLVWANLNASLCLDNTGTPHFIIGMVENITERKRTEETLRNSEERYRRLVEGLPVVVWSSSVKEGILYVSSRVESILGYPPKVLYENPWLWNDSIHPQDRPRVAQAIKAFALGEDLDVEYRISDSFGNWRWFFDRSIGRRVRDGETIIEGISIDITKRKRAEESLLIEKNFSEPMINSLPGTFYLFDENGKIIRWNKNLEKIFGYTSEEISNLSLLDFIAREDHEAVTTAFKKVFTEGEAKREANAITKNGEKIPFLFTGLRLIIEGKPYLIGVGIDITERKRAEEALRAKSEEQELLLDNIDARIWYLTDAETYGAVNKGYADFFGMEKKDLVGKKHRDILKKDEAEVCIAGNREVFEKGRKFHSEEWVANSEGEKRLHSTIKTPKIDDEGNTKYVCCVATDITERKRTEEKVHIYQEELRSLSSELSLIEERERRRIATDLHDRIGQTLALTKIKLGSLREMASPTELAMRVNQICEVIDQAIQSMRTLIFELSPPVLYELGFDAAVEWLAEQIQDQHHIQIDLENDRRSDPMSDEIRILLFKAVREVLINIVKHAKAHKAKVSTRREDNTIWIIVEDDGVGFSLPEDKILGKINGYGLFSIRERLRHLGGSFKIESELGCGTRVTLVAPLE